MINKNWDIVLKDEMEKEYFKKLGIFVKQQRGCRIKSTAPFYDGLLQGTRQPF